MGVGVDMILVPTLPEPTDLDNKCKIRPYAGLHREKSPEKKLRLSDLEPLLPFWVASFIPNSYTSTIRFPFPQNKNRPILSSGLSEA